MSKNTRNTEFRKIDVDQYDEEKYKDDEALDAQSPPTGPNEAEISQLLNTKNLDALKVVLRSAPLGSKNQQVKDTALAQVLRVLMSIRTNQMEEAVKSLERNELDTLMKYIYRGFESPSEGSSGHLLAWHEKVYNTAGLGCIVRVLSDRKRV